MRMLLHQLSHQHLYRVATPFRRPPPLKTHIQYKTPTTMQARISQPPSEQLEAEFRHMIAGSPQIILGTQSSSRRAIMDELAKEYGFEYTCQVAGIDEEAIRHPEPSQLVLMLARAKADAILAKLQGAMDMQSDQARQTYLITCDQVVLYDGQIREKPIDAQQARAWIQSYATLPACTCGSTRVINIGSGAAAETVDLAECHFGPIPDATIDKLIQEGEVMWCSGGLMVEHPDVVPHLQRMVGTQDSVMGLSKQAVMEMLVNVWKQQQQQQ